MKHSVALVDAVQRRAPTSKVALIADSAMADCCVDFTSAAHIHAKAIVKFGETCWVAREEGCVVYHVPKLEMPSQECIQILADRITRLPPVMWIGISTESIRMFQAIHAQLSHLERGIFMISSLSTERPTHDTPGHIFIMDSCLCKRSTIPLQVPHCSVSYLADGGSFEDISSSRTKSKR